MKAHKRRLTSDEVEGIREALYDWCFNSCPLLLGDELTFEGLVRLVLRLMSEINDERTAS
jgi:hypothetical protein